MRAGRLLVGSAAAALALAPIPAYANPDIVRAGAEMADASAQDQEEDFSSDHIVGVVFALVIFTVIIFASDSDGEDEEDPGDPPPPPPVSP